MPWALAAVCHAGLCVHSQKWEEGTDYANKNVVIIGSGATAVTMAPVMAKEAASVTVLQVRRKQPHRATVHFGGWGPNHNYPESVCFPVQASQKHATHVPRADLSGVHVPMTCGVCAVRSS